MRRGLPTGKTLGAAACAAFVVVATAACGGGAADSSGPAEGMQRIESGWLRLDVPGEWSKGGPTTDVWTETYQDATGDDASLQLSLSPEYGTFDAGMSIARVMAVLQVKKGVDFERLETLPSSDEDIRLRDNISYTYTGDDGQEYEGVVLAASDEDEHGVLVQLTGQDLDEDLVEQIDTSLEVQADGE